MSWITHYLQRAPRRCYDPFVSTKDAVIEMIRNLPDDVTLPDIMAELCFRQKVDQGLRELDEGQGIPHDQARERLGKWLK